MTLKFCWLEKSQQWAVVGPAEEMRLGMVEVTRGNGEVKTERIVSLSKVYEGEGGEKRRLGFLSVMPWGA